MSIVLSVTGHRPDKLGGYATGNPVQAWVYERLRAALVELAPKKVVVGMAQGVDQWTALTCISLHIPFIAAIPFEGQEETWPKPAQNLYRIILGEAAKVIPVSAPGYTPNKMQVRDEYVVQFGEKLLAVWDGSDGGTFNTLRYAAKIGKYVIHIDPRECEAWTTSRAA